MYRLESKRIKCTDSQIGARNKSYWLISKKMNALTRRVRSYASGSTEPNRHTALLDDHRNVTAAARVNEHFIEGCGVFLDIPVLDINVSRCKVLTGCDGVGSGVLSEDHDLVGHGKAPSVGG